MKTLIKLFLLLSLFTSACNRGKKGSSELNESSFKEKNSVPSITYVTADPTFQTASDQCSDILQQSIMQEFKFTKKQDYIEALHKAITMTDDEIKNKESSTETSIDIGYKLITMAFGSSNEDKEYSNIRKKYIDNTTLDISKNDLTQLEVRIADPNIVNAWSECMSNRKGILYKISGDQSQEFTIQIQYVPQPLQPDKIRISNFTTSGSIEPSGNIIFKRGIKLKSNESITQKFKRKSSGIGSLTIDSRLNPVNIYVSALQPKKTDSTTIWVSTDEHGIKFSQVFITPLPECKSCEGNPGIEVSKIENLENKNSRIYQVLRECLGNCNWNYSKASDERGDFFKILASKNQFYWQRFSQGPPCAEKYIAY